MSHFRQCGTPVLISFSGIDGAGKSTQIEALESALANSGRRFCRLAFWDDVVVLKRLREGVTHKVFKSERGIGAPGKPVQRRDKNVRAWYLTLVRAFFYLLDAVNLRKVVARTRRLGDDVIIFDRYVFDEMANLPSNWPARIYIRLLAAIVPRPDLALVLDADPEAACRRKPEYPIDFAKKCRQSYLKLAEMVGMTVIPPLPLAEAKELVWRSAQPVLAARPARMSAVDRSSTVRIPV